MGLWPSKSNGVKIEPETKPMYLDGVRIQVPVHICHRFKEEFHFLEESQEDLPQMADEIADAANRFSSAIKRVLKSVSGDSISSAPGSGLDQVYTIWSELQTKYLDFLKDVQHYYKVVK